MTPFYRFAARGAIIPFLKMVSRQKVTGLENIPREGGFIAVANHLTDLDSLTACLLYTSPSPRDRTRSRMPSSA